MSTRGSFIIRKDGKDKELYIPFDGHPGVAGRDVVRMIKSLNLDALYDLLVAEDDLNQSVLIAEAFNEDPHDYSLRLCVDCVQNGHYYYYRQMKTKFIQDSLFCEYGYILDLDERNLLFYTGFQKTPQEGNRYGNERKDNGYYPCH